MSECGHCYRKRINVTGDFRLFVYPEIIQPIMAEEGIINSVEDLKDLLTCIEIALAKGGSGTINCPVCSGGGGV